MPSRKALRSQSRAGQAARRRPRLVVTWHNAVLQRGVRALLLTGLERLVARGGDVTLGASSDLVDRARQLGARDARLAPVAAPDLPSPARSRSEMREELFALAGGPVAPVLLAVGRLAEQKDYPTLLSALADHWPADVERPLLVIVGEGPLRADLERTARERGLRVLLLGQRSDVPDLLAAADVYVLSSRWEARALVVQEAARAGLPIVATEVGGVPELIADAAKLVPAGDPTALAAALAILVTDGAERQRLGAAARARSASWPGEAETTEQVRAVYIGLLSDAG
jgi:glycosyltransferase involved in cell wall biosynthesis